MCVIQCVMLRDDYGNDDDGNNDDDGSFAILGAVLASVLLGTCYQPLRDLAPLIFLTHAI